MVALAFLAAARVLGGHLVHVIVLAAWVLAVVTVLAWPSARDGAAPGSGRRGAWLQGAALGLFVAAATHLAVAPDHFREWWLFGLFFLGVSAAQLSMGALLLSKPSRRLVLAATVASGAVVVLWAWTRLVGIPLGPTAGTTEPFGVLDVMASTAELVTVVCGAVALTSRGVGASWRWSSWSGPMRSALFAASAVVVVALAAAPKG
ncbi:MAG TPA: hypothetical protein VEI83_10130 [Acidimicrobiales bacterium]|nr:hypothetical protein [Acidimicrobiales bacterium]